MKKINNFLNQLYQRRYKHYTAILIGCPKFFSENFFLKICKKRYVPNLFKTLLMCYFLARKNDNKIFLEFIDNYIDNSFNKSKYLLYLLGDNLIRRRKYNKDTEKIILGAIEKNAEITANFRAHDFIVQYYGYKSKKLQIIIQRLKSKKIFPFLTKREKCRLLLLLFHHNYDEMAHDIAENDISYRYIENNYPSLYLISKLYPKRLKPSFFYCQANDMYKKIIKQRKKIERFWKLNKEKLCIIGNSPCEINLYKGNIIDQYQYPIRINEYSLLYSQDYGKKEHSWVRVANNEIISDHYKSNSLVIIAANNFAVKRRDAYSYLLPFHLYDTEYTVIPSHIYRYLMKRLGGLPSTGIAILYWIYTIVGPLNKEQIFGFSHFQEDVNFTDHYYDDLTDIKNHLHEWHKERLLMQEMVIEND